MFAQLLPTIVGGVASMLNKPPKMSPNQMLGELRSILGQSRKLYDTTDFDAMNDRYESDITGIAGKVAGRALANQEASVYARGGDPDQYNTSNMVARGVVMRDAANNAASTVAEKRYNTPMLRMSMLGAMGDMAKGGAGTEMQQNMLDYNTQMQAWNASNAAINTVGSAVPWGKLLPAGGGGGGATPWISTKPDWAE